MPTRLLAVYFLQAIQRAKAPGSPMLTGVDTSKPNYRQWALTLLDSGLVQIISDTRTETYWIPLANCASLVPAPAPKPTPKPAKNVRRTKPQKT